MKPPSIEHSFGGIRSNVPDLPVELIADVLDNVGDWELSKAVGVPTSLPEPNAWASASVTDHAILTGYLPFVRAANPCTYPPTRIGAAVAVRFGYLNVSLPAPDDAYYRSLNTF